MKLDRRNFVRLLGAATAAGALPASIKKAMALPAHNRRRSIEDIEHIVILMQENRSFDHYFGTLRGVRGFGDPRAVRLPSGDPVWQQPFTQNGVDGHVAPFHPEAADLGLQFLEDLPHGWIDTHAAWNQGKYDRWVPSKGTTTMAYLTRKDIPYHYALADAFTVCDAYYCSFLGATDPNRYHMWTGWTGNDGLGGGPVLDNAEAGYDWKTFPERLQQAGISWKIYQDAGAGLDADHYWGWGTDPYIGNYGDNSLLYFHQYQQATPGSPLYEGARTATNVSAGGTLVEAFAKDVSTGKLPQVSWIVAPESYTEHPNWPANYGAWYISQFLDALTSQPDVWSKTALFLMYDENDGFFDHLVPPTPPMSRAQGWSNVDTTHELFAGAGKYTAGPYGLGVRVPMIVISPWSRGGWVSSEVFDHTSLIRFIERRFERQSPGLIESNITAWRRAVVGDLTSAFDFVHPNDELRGGRSLSLPSTAAYAPPDRDVHKDYVPVPPAASPTMAQEAGLRPARPLPYELNAFGHHRADGTFEIGLANTGSAAAVFQIRPAHGDAGPWTYTLAAGTHGSDTWMLNDNPDRAYDLSVYGPNGFLRTFRGRVSAVEDGSQRDAVNVAVHASYQPHQGGIALELINRGLRARHVRITDAYEGRALHQVLSPGETWRPHWNLERSFGWYDLLVEIEGDKTFQRQLAGHVETGENSVSDPLLSPDHCHAS